MAISPILQPFMERFERAAQDIDLEAIQAIVTEATVVHHGAPSAEREHIAAWVSCWHGYLLMRKDDTDRALEHLGSSRSYFDQSGNAFGLGLTDLFLGILYNMKDKQKALSHSVMAHDALSKIGSEYWDARAIGMIGNVYTDTGSPEKGVMLQRESLVIHERLNNVDDIIRSLTNIGRSCMLMGDLDAASSTLIQCYDLSSSNHRHRSSYTTSKQLGHVFLRAGQYGDALTWQHRSYVAAKSLNNIEDLGDVANEIGVIHYWSGNLHLARSWYERALEHSVKSGNPAFSTLIRGNLALIEQDLGNKQQALKLFSELLDEDSGVSSRHRLFFETHRIGLYLDLGSVESATSLLSWCEATYQSDITDKTLVKIEVNRGRVALLNNDIERALDLFKSALAIAEGLSLKWEITDLHKRMRLVYLELGDHVRYAFHAELFIQSRDEMLSSEQQRQLSIVEKQVTIDEERRLSEAQRELLYNTLPSAIAERLIRGEVVNDRHDMATIIFLDIVGFTQLSAQLEAHELIRELDAIFCKCDAICATYGLTKIKTIGDSYLAVALDADNGARQAADAAIEMMRIDPEVVLRTEANLPSCNFPITFRIGMHCGAIVAGVLGKERMQYDVWGDTVNVASRMESTSEAGRIQLSDTMATMLNQSIDELHNKAHLIHRGLIDIKGKGQMSTYWLEAL